MALESLPVELLVMIAQCLDAEALSYLVRANRTLYHALVPVLYRVHGEDALRYTVLHARSYPLTHTQEQTTRLAFTHGDFSRGCAHGRTIELAAAKGLVSVVEGLVSQNNQEIYEALVYAARQRHAAVVDVLARYRVDVHAADFEGYTALDWAASSGDTPIVATLVAHGADVHRRSRRGYTPLLLAAGNGHAATAEFLLQHGADVHCVTEEGRTALQLAMRNEREEVVALLEPLAPRETSV
ncbi:ankyrin [Aspergillus japonicus CBS 114.51]|uniref:Ankyrin n=1 Tax=Aspergillus japonicus CBS 114.51 TaxID=1448312 RepID=A0A8T8WWA9_ASPJA|nr:ankyrin [Aspergillus japonicus CBS 114.51]RAH80136.1 ankyrin [Aspergillus japonicus CBS 114.51]